MKTIYVDDVVTSYSPKIGSHRSGWTRVLVDALRYNYPYDEVYSPFNFDPIRDGHVDVWAVAHPMEFNGVYNLFGGWTQEVKDRVQRLLDFDGKLVSLEIPMPNLRAILEPRAAKTDINFTDLEWFRIEQKCINAGFVGNPFEINRDCARQVIGDSHSVAQYLPGSTISRFDGLTLHGLLKSDKLNYAARGLDTLVVSAGNIDIRHHFGRDGRDDPREFAINLIKELWRQVRMVQSEFDIKRIQIVDPYPVEFEGRRLPKTGWYKGAPFATPREARAELVDIWRDVLLDWFQDDEIYHWPTHWYTMDPEEYAKTYMEKPGSVHLSPEYHRWDYINDRFNEKLR